MTQTEQEDEQVEVLVGKDTVLPSASGEALDVEQAAPTHNASTRINAWLFRNHEETRHFGLEELSSLITNDENVVWLDLADFAEDDLRALAGPLQLHESAIRIALDAWQRPRLSAFDGQFFVTVTVPHLEQESRRVRAGQLDLFVGRNCLLSAHKQPLPFASTVLARARQNPTLVQLDSAFMLYIILDELLDYYEELSEAIENDIEEMEQRALSDTSDDFLNDLLQLKRYVFALSRLAVQHRPVFAAFLRPDFAFISGDEVEPYFQELQERLDRLLDLLLPAKENINGAFEIYTSHVAHRTNGVMKLLTIVSTVVLPGTLILGFFGTSFEGLPLYDTGDFILMVALIVLSTVGVLWMFRRQRWM